MVIVCQGGSTHFYKYSVYTHCNIILNMTVLILLLFCLVIPSCWSACKPGCGTQDVGETPVDDLPCLEAMESISNFVLQKPK